jgi:hypothetical protein
MRSAPANNTIPRGRPFGELKLLSSTQDPHHTAEHLFFRDGRIISRRGIPACDENGSLAIITVADDTMGAKISALTKEHDVPTADVGHYVAPDEENVATKNRGKHARAPHNGPQLSERAKGLFSKVMLDSFQG